MKMKTLTSENVQAVLKDCLFREGEPTDSAIKAEGVVRSYGFHPERIAANKNDIQAMLSQLPDEFKSGGGGGWSFLNACMTKEGEQWGEHINIEQLVALGIAAGLARYQLPREMWPVLPGGMPYFSVDA